LLWCEAYILRQSHSAHFYTDVGTSMTASLDGCVSKEVRKRSAHPKPQMAPEARVRLISHAVLPLLGVGWWINAEGVSTFPMQCQRTSSSCIEQVSYRHQMRRTVERMTPRPSLNGTPRSEISLTTQSMGG